MIQVQFQMETYLLQSLVMYNYSYRTKKTYTLSVRRQWHCVYGCFDVREHGNISRKIIPMHREYLCTNIVFEIVLTKTSHLRNNSAVKKRNFFRLFLNCKTK